MKKLKVFSSLFLASVFAMSCAATTVGAAPLTWKDGARANYHFTYTDGDEGVKSVTVSDTNETVNREVKEGETVTTQTGTVVGRDGYTNVTTFTVELQRDYDLVGISGNVGDGKIERVIGKENTYTFQFTDKGAEGWCYGDDVDFSIKTAKVDSTLIMDFYNNNDDVRDNFVTRKIQGVPSGVEITEEYLYNELGVPEEYKLVGNDTITTHVTDNNVVTLVKQEKATSGVAKRGYSFTYANGTKDIESVKCELDGNTYDLDVNEVVNTTTSADVTKAKVATFTVKVPENKKLVVDCAGTDNYVRDNGDGTYTFQITVKGYSHNKQANFDFNLSTADK